MALERLSAEYERVAGKPVGDDLLLGTVIRCLPQAIRQRLQLQMSESTTFAEVRSYLMSYESTTTQWSTTKVQQALGVIAPPQQSSDQHAQDPVPMDISRMSVKDAIAELNRIKGGKKGPGKGGGKKGDPKGKKGKGDGGKPFQSYSGYQPGKGKGGKYDAGGKKGQGKGGGKKGDPKGKTNPNIVCWFCGKTGHPQHLCYKNPNRKQVNQVEQTASVVSSAAPSTVGPSASQHPAAASNVTTVRRVESDPFVFDFSSLPSASNNDVRMVRVEPDGPVFEPWTEQHFDESILPNFLDRSHVHFAVTCPVFDMSYSDDDGVWSVAPGAPSPQAGEPHELELPSVEVVSAVSEQVVCAQPLPFRVRAVSSQRSEVQMEVILDSGADLSCLPMALGSTGVKGPSAGRIAVRDAQGGRLPVNRTRDVEFSLKAHDGREVVWKERCIVTSVTQPLLALGKMMRGGWIPTQDEFGMFLRHEDSGLMVPIDFRGNSLMVHATLRRVLGDEEEQASEVYVRYTSAGPSQELIDASFGWQTLESSGHFVWRGQSDRFIDPTTLVPITWPNRTTLVYAEGGWIMLEHCVDWLQLADPTALFPHGMCDCITILSMNVESPGEFGVEVENVDSHVNDSGQQAPGDNVGGDDEPMPAAPGGWEPQEFQAESPAPIADGVEAAGPPPPLDSVVTVNGVGLSMGSTLGALRAGCKFLNLSQSGSKLRCFQRLQAYVQKERLSAEVQVAEQARSGDSREPNMQFMPQPPSEEARLLHEITHLPFANWCSHCVAMKSVPDQHRLVPEGDAREHPTISFDLFYTGYATAGEVSVEMEDAGAGDKAKLTCLIMHCNHTNAIGAVPLPDKSASSMKHAAVELVRFCQLLGHTEVELRCDQEPCMLQLQGLALSARKRLGFRTRIRNPPIGEHQANGFAEKSIDVIRSLANVFLDSARHKYKIEIPVSHPLFSWSFVHAAWVYTRFKVRAGFTAYEKIAGTRYRGKLVPYAEPVFAYIRPSQKGNAKWVMSVFLTKSVINDMFLVGTPNGVMLTKSVRRSSQPWELESKLADAIKGAPWNLHLGALGTKMVPQARTRAPNAVAVPAVDPIPELMPPPGGMPRAPLAAEAARGSEDTGHGVSDVPRGEEAGVPNPGTSEGSMPPSRRATLLLSRGDRTPLPASGSVPGAAPGPVTPLMSPLSDSAMLEEFLRKRPAEPEAGGDEVTKTARLRRVAEEDLAVNDEELDVPSEWTDPSVLPFLESASSAVVEPAKVGSDAVCSNTERSEVQGAMTKAELQLLEERLWFPEEPSLSEAQQAEVDGIADLFEVQRLIRKGVLRCAGLKGEVSSENVKKLSTKFVRTWRKKVRNGVEMTLRRSRLCAREYKWLESDRLDIFSPATNTSVAKLLPWLFAKKRTASDADADPVAMLTLDVRDAYLTVPQRERVRASMPRDFHDAYEYDFEKCVPGQRDGALMWREHFLAFLESRFSVHVCTACPSLISIDGSMCLLHVDDMFLVAKKGWLEKVFIPAIESTFECTCALASQPGEQVSFLKRMHRITESGVIVQAQSDLIHKMCDVVGVSARKASALPCSKEILKCSDSKPLEPDRATAFRTAIGIAMYISSDRADCAFAIRTLGQRLSAPNADDWSAVQKLAAYMRSTAGYALHLTPKAKGYSILQDGTQHDGTNHLLETFSDSDWCGSHQNRRSMSAAVHFLDGAAVFFSCRGQKTVSLSSCEAEWYAAVTAACDALYLRQTLCFLLGETPQCMIRIDNQAARQLAHRQGPSAKTRHVDARLFWVQEKVKDRVLMFGPVSGVVNPSDVGTKVLAEKRFRAMLGAQQYVDTECRDLDVGCDEWTDLLSEVAASVQLRRIRSRFASLRGPARRRMEMIMMIGRLCQWSEPGELGPW